MKRVIWCAPDGSWGECKSDDLLIIDESSLTDDDRDMLMGGNLSDSEVRAYLSSHRSAVAFLSDEERQVVRDALSDAANVWRADYEAEWAMAKEARKSGTSQLVCRTHTKNAKGFRLWAELASGLVSKFL